MRGVVQCRPFDRQEQQYRLGDYSLTFRRIKRDALVLMHVKLTLLKSLNYSVVELKREMSYR